MKAAFRRQDRSERHIAKSILDGNEISPEKIRG